MKKQSVTHYKGKGMVGADPVTIEAYKSRGILYAKLKAIKPMKAYEKINKVRELMEKINEVQDGFQNLSEDAYALGVVVPASIMAGDRLATEWWADKQEKFLQKLLDEEVRAAALAKLNEAERKVLGL